MGRKNRFAPHLRRFSCVPRVPCLYVAELHQTERVLLKVGVGGNAMGRMISLNSEVKREHGADVGRFAIFSMPTYKAAYEAETRAVKLLEEIAPPLCGHREFFAGLTFEAVCEKASLAAGSPVAFSSELAAELAEPKAEQA